MSAAERWSLGWSTDGKRWRSHTSEVFALSTATMCCSTIVNGEFAQSHLNKDMMPRRVISNEYERENISAESVGSHCMRCREVSETRRGRNLKSWRRHGIKIGVTTGVWSYDDGKKERTILKWRLNIQRHEFVALKNMADTSSLNAEIYLHAATAYNR